MAEGSPILQKGMCCLFYESGKKQNLPQQRRNGTAEGTSAQAGDAKAPHFETADLFLYASDSPANSPSASVKMEKGK